MLNFLVSRYQASVTDRRRQSSIRRLPLQRLLVDSTTTIVSGNRRSWPSVSLHRRNCIGSLRNTFAAEPSRNHCCIQTELVTRTWTICSEGPASKCEGGFDDIGERTEPRNRSRILRAKYQWNSSSKEPLNPTSPPDMRRYDHLPFSFAAARYPGSR
jgi:hypothetical protein